MKKKRILIIEDDRTTVNLIIKVLNNADPDKYDYSHAEDGLVAQTLIKMFKPDLIVLDILLPRVNGFQVLRQLRSEKSTKDIRVLAVSGLVTKKRDKDTAKDWGADDFMPKPINGKSLINRINQLLGD